MLSMMPAEKETFRYLPDGFEGVSFSVKSTPDDFQVEEIPAYEPCGEGDHTYLWIEKRGISTRQAIRRLSEAYGVHEDHFSAAGLKDARALTRQWISVETRKMELPEISSVDSVTVLKKSRHANKLRIGHLRGNRFIIRLANLNKQEETRLGDRVHAISMIGFPNYFGQQRFGMHGTNWLAGQALVQKNIRRAEELAGPYKVRQKKMAALYVNAFQSWMFNYVVEERLERLGRLQEGDLAYRHDNGAVFMVTDAAAEQARADRFEISPSGPVFGYKMTQAAGKTAESESAVLAQFGVRLEDFKDKAARRMPGERRPLRVRPENTGITFQQNEQGFSALLSFSLPSGCYATSFLRELGKEKMEYVEK